MRSCKQRQKQDVWAADFNLGLPFVKFITLFLQTLNKNLAGHVQSAQLGKQRAHKEAHIFLLCHAVTQGWIIKVTLWEDKNKKRGRQRERDIALISSRGLWTICSALGHNTQHEGLSESPETYPTHQHMESRLQTVCGGQACGGSAPLLANWHSSMVKMVQSFGSHAFVFS